MTTSERQPSPAQARFMAKVFIISTILGMLVVFLNVSMRSYNLRMQQAELKAKQANGEAANPAASENPAATAPAEEPKAP